MSTSAVSRRSLGGLSAVSRRPLGCLSAVSRLSLGGLSAASHRLVRLELWQNLVCELLRRRSGHDGACAHLAELHAPRVKGAGNLGQSRAISCTRVHTLPSCTLHWSKELMFQMTPCTKILCSYIAISEPSVRGVSLSNKIELLGLLPSNTLCGASAVINREWLTTN